VIPKWISASRGLSIQLDSDPTIDSAPDASSSSCRAGDAKESAAEGESEDGDIDSSSEGGEGRGEAGLDAHWHAHAWQASSSEEKLKMVTGHMLCHMLSSSGSLPLALIRSPLEYVLDDPQAPHLRPGLYVGDYGHHMYGQFKYEVLLVEFRECTRENVGELFARPVDGEGVPRMLQQILDGVPPNETCSFLVGTKVTGDIHVPAGQATFVALLSPRYAREQLDTAREAQPRQVINRSTRQQECVHSSWPGFGTLAMPGFGAPSWASGWLVRLEALPDDTGNQTGGDRFGFMWDRNQDMVVLEYIPSQLTSPFLSRKWLPEGLR